jgi:hypothetical protein
MFKGAVWLNLKRAIYADAFFDGDLSYLSQDLIDEVYEYMPVYEFMFNNVNPLHVGDNKEEDFDPGLTNHQIRHLMKEYLAPYDNQENHVVSSWILGSRFASDKPHHQIKILDVDVEMESVIDLGDSRNFDSVSQVISKVRQIQRCKLYVGSDTSWYHIARLYNKPGIQIWQR